MEAKFKVCKKGTCGIQIQGLELENGEYGNTTTAIRNYKYDQSITLNIVQSVTSDNKYVLENVSVVPHIDSDISDFEFSKDGLYSISHIILPTEQYAQYDPSLQGSYHALYYYNTSDNKIKLMREDGKDIEISIDQLLQVNPEATVGNLPNSVIRGDKDTFCICYLNNCFYTLSKNLLSSYCGKCLNKLNAPQQDIFNRDLIWMSMNVISYLIEDNKLVEAQRILESLSGCGNICQNSNSKKSSDCGCY